MIDAAADVARREYEAGNIPNLTLAQINATAQQTRLDLLRARVGVRAMRENLNRLLGLTSGQTEWRLAGNLPLLPAAHPAFDHLEALALGPRLALAGAHPHVS